MNNEFKSYNIMWDEYLESIGWVPQQGRVEMSKLREAAAAALEALEDLGMKHYESTGEVLHRDVYEALRTALAEPVQDERTAVADLRCAVWLDPECADKGACQSLKFKRAAEPQEPFGWVTVRRLSQRFENHADHYQFYQFYPGQQVPYLDNVDECHAVYTHPAPVRQPFSDEKIMDLVRDMSIQMRWPSTPLDIARAIEKAHGIGVQHE